MRQALLGQPDRSTRMVWPAGRVARKQRTVAFPSNPAAPSIMSQTRETDPFGATESKMYDDGMRVTALLADMTPHEFLSLRDGTYQFGIIGPDGDAEVVCLRVWHGRRKTRSAQFDLWPSRWNIKTDRVEQFIGPYAEYWDAHISQVPKGTTIHGPGGQSTLSLSALRDDIGAWLYRSAQFILDGQNLYDIRPDFVKATV